jgi:hypothetical protein
MSELLPDSVRRLLCVDGPMRFRQPSVLVGCDYFIETIIPGFGSLWIVGVGDVRDSHGGAYPITNSRVGGGNKLRFSILSAALYRGDLTGLDRPVSVVLSTAPSLRRVGAKHL